MRVSRWLLVVLFVVFSAGLAWACGGEEEEEAGAPAATSPAGETPEAREDGDVDAGGEAFDDVRVPAGADETGSGEWSGTIPGLVPGQGADPGDYTSIEFKEYEVDDSPSDIVEFFRKELKDWDEGFVFSGGEEGDEGGVGIWTRDDDQVAVWILVSSSNGGSDLVVIRGSTD